MLRKFAAMDILGAELASSGSPLIKNAHRHTFEYESRPGFLYVRSRMISSRCNDNFDAFPAEELAKGYRSFVGKPAFVNHHNDDHRRARGVIIDAALHEDRNPDGSPDTWVEGLHEIDALSFPKLARAILLGHVARTSMGVDVDYSICSKCGNKATTPLEYCRDVPMMKGKKYFAFTASGAKVGKLIFETCFGLRFFENSFLVEPPADPTAYVLDKPMAGPGLEHLTAGLARTASTGFPPEWPANRREIIRVDPRSLVAPEPEPRSASLLVQATPCLACRGRDTVADPSGNAECVGCGHTWHEARARDTLRAEAATYASPADHPWFQEHPVSHENIVGHWNQATPDEKASGKRWYADAHLVAGAIAKGHDHPYGADHLGAGMLAVYSPQQGWAGNMHNAARVLHEGKGLGGKGSGLFASAAQKTSADRLLSGEHYNDVLSGPKIRDFAHLIEHGGDADPQVPHVVIDRHALGVAAGKSLTNDEYDAAPIKASAKRKDGSINRRYYDHVVGAYHQAAAQISGTEGEPVAGHQVQAVTWLVRQRLNQAQERAKAEQGADPRLDKGRARSRQNAEHSWDEFRRQNLPHLEHGGPGTGYQASRRLAYGETKAPAKVDTLRDENCPICGEDSGAWDGNTCAVCQYVAPPPQFADPDLDKAKQNDLRQEQDAYDDSIQPDPEAAAAQAQDILVCDNCGTDFPAGHPESTDTADPQAGDTAADGPSEGDVCPACAKGQLVAANDLDTEPAQDNDVPPGQEDDPAQPAGPGGQGPVDPRDLVDDDEDEDAPDEDDDEDEDAPDEDDDEDEDRPKKPAKGKPFPPK